MALVNNLLEKVRQDRMCTSLFVKLVPTPPVIMMAKSAGYDSVLIDLEHTTLSIADSATLCAMGLATGITPFVRVPYQCGDGFVQRVLDNGAMGIVFPHCDSVEGATAAAKICKYPPFGKRSISAHFPQLGCQSLSQDQMMPYLDQIASTVIVMCETKDCLVNIDQVAAVEGVDAILIGVFDLSTDLGILGDWQNPKLKEALQMVGTACKKHGKIFGVAGLNHLPEVLRWAINDLGVRFVVGKGDTAILADGVKNSHDILRSMESPRR